MSAPVLWGVVPLVAAGVLLLLRRWPRPVNWAGIGLMFLMAVSAWALPVDQAVRLGPWSLRLGDTLTVLGRQFVVMDVDRGMLALIYFLAGLWFLGALAANPGSFFVPLGIAFVVTLNAALTVEPFLYAALFLEMAVLVSVPFLHPPGKVVGQGVLRYLAFQTIGMPFILFTGWILDRIGGDLASPEQLVIPTVLVGFGFAFLLAVFPFHTWLPMLAEEVHPYTVGFVFLMLPGVVSLFGIGFLNEYAWLRNSDAVYSLLRGVGFLMTLAGGVWAALELSRGRRWMGQKERHLGRILGFAGMVETGLSILAISTRGGEGLRLFFALLVPRAVGYLVWSLTLAYLEARLGTLSFRELQGIGRKLPYPVIALTFAVFSVGGMPIFAGFPARLTLFMSLAQENSVAALGAVLGGVGILIAGTRMLAVFVMLPAETPVDEPPIAPESPGWKAIFTACALVLLLLGIFPRWFLFLTDTLPLAFGALVR